MNAFVSQVGTVGSARDVQISTLWAPFRRQGHLHPILLPQLLVLHVAVSMVGVANGVDHALVSRAGRVRGVTSHQQPLLRVLTQRCVRPVCLCHCVGMECR